MLVWLLMPCFLVLIMSILYQPTFWGVVFLIVVVVSFLMGWFDQPPPKVRRARYRAAMKSLRKQEKIIAELKRKGLLLICTPKVGLNNQLTKVQIFL